MADEYILKRNALAILMGDKVNLSSNFVSISMAIDPSSIAKFQDINFTCDRHIDLIKEIPAEDVAPVVHGKWYDKAMSVPNGHGQTYGKYGCSVCKHKVKYKTNYCPNCGARMDGAE